jgi:DNA-3-methyladenine glycosylase
MFPPSKRRKIHVGKLIQPAAFSGKNTVALARSLLGKVLVRRIGGGGEETRHILTELEAYHSENDLACHANKGRTPRTDVLYRAAGIWYVYLCYGIHEMLNLVVGPEGFPAAILVRGVHDVIGPGRVTKTLQINRTLNGQTASPVSGLWIEDCGIKVPKTWIQAGPRVGVDYAGEIWAAKPWRFQIEAQRLPELAKRLVAGSTGVSAAP